MLILAIETATPQVGVALASFDGAVASFHASRDRRHAESLVPAIDFVCRQAGVVPADLGAVAVDVGPGLFTGLRVGLSTAKTMAHALRIPMVGISSLDLLAFSARLTERHIVAGVDARRGEIFVATYRRVHGGVQRLTEPTVTTPDVVGGVVEAFGEDCLFVGDGMSRYADTFCRLRGVEMATESLRYPSAAALAELAHSKAVREEFVQPRDIEPIYLREPDATPNWKSAARGGPNP
ncbi:MAG: tRNA (adenosine(37)-N6)-threonylcarbamoyltransferase complex dimerization subunit type 1 TsaB [Actinomycetia bacterium]|nr:tRNA (adenosine(37)-N6)-threonylcarbamoyltransferase complex dimerization subunit type 1 TsaB [Actinomycetes bacterium]MCP4963191.1 tRNA (adenosine(37)-N6)-threonylcarbamoyltransferase complex dimerization subunit type 1 TsaB [Actinomycetes bacterium]